MRRPNLVSLTGPRSFSVLNNVLISQMANVSNLQLFYKDRGGRLGHGTA